MKTLYYKFQVRSAGALFGHHPHVKLRRRIIGPFWTTVDAMIPVGKNGDESIDDLVEWAKDELWEREALRVRRTAHWSGTSEPAMEEL